MLGFFLLAALLMALHTAFSGKDASLRLKVQHSLRSGQLSLWVDGDLAYSGSLVGNAKRKFGLIPEVQGNLSETLPVAPGTHQIKLRIVSDSGERENTISGDFAHNQQQILSVNASRADLSLHWQPFDLAVYGRRRGPVIFRQQRVVQSLRWHTHDDGCRFDHLGLDGFRAQGTTEAHSLRPQGSARKPGQSAKLELRKV